QARAGRRGNQLHHRHAGRVPEPVQRVPEPADAAGHLRRRARLSVAFHLVKEGPAGPFFMAATVKFRPGRPKCRGNHARTTMRRPALILLTLASTWLAGCVALGIETATAVNARKEAEGRAIGSACRHAVRSIESCFQS